MRGTCLCLLAALGLLLGAPAMFAQLVEDLPPEPWVQEDGARLESLLISLQDALPLAESDLATARAAASQEGLSAPDKQARDTAARAAESRVETLKSRIEACRAAIPVARMGPTAAQLAARREHDALLAQALGALADLQPGPEAPVGKLARAITAAEEELAHLATLSDAVDRADVRQSRVFERLSDVEKLEMELRWATERFKVKIDEYDHLSETVFGAYIAFERRALDALVALETAAQKRRDFENTPAAALALAGRNDNAASIAATATAIREQLQRRRSGRGTAANGQIFSLQGRLREIQRMIDLREDYREQLERDLDKVKERLVNRQGTEKPVANEPAPRNNQSADYQRLSAAIDLLEAEEQTIRAEVKRLAADRVAGSRVLVGKQEVEREVDAEYQRLQSALARLKQENPDTSPWRATLVIFAEQERLDAVSERLGAARLDTRRAQTQLEVIDRRLAALEQRSAEIAQETLPTTRQQYWRSLGYTALERGARIAAVFLLAWLLLWLIKRTGTPILERMMRRSDTGDGNDAYRRQRSRTLFAVFMTTMRVVVFLTAAMFALIQFDIDYGPLLVAAGGVSLAVGFGAQSLVKDFFSGFFILLEGQYSIGDVIEINGKSGTVEDLNLRTTVLRSVNGDVHTIPNGVIAMSTNQTKIWSRAVLDVGVAYEENVDDVMALLEAVGREMQQDAVWGRRVQDIILPGVDSFGDNAINIRVLLRTRAGEQWGAAREYRKRVKRKFDEFGVEIPWPQRVVTQKSRDEAKDKKDRAALQKYVRRIKGEKEPETMPLSVEERDRAETLAKEAVKVAESEARSQSSGVAAPNPETPRPPLTDAERVAREMADNILRDKHDSANKPPPPK
ncbi:MAG: mechanosensitive ion channel [Planctomycetes bacterium]|nr:mechanosensitive ion channel [Planctomycetota bacterium]